MNLKRKLKRWFLFGRAKRRFYALQLFLNASWYKINLSSYVSNFTKSSLSAEEKKELKQSFCLRTSSRENNDPVSLEEPYRDTPYTLALYRYNEFCEEKYEYLACLGFDVKKSQVVVKQIQGNPGKGEILRLFKWERMLLAILTDWAKKNGFKQIRVIQAKNQPWYREHRAKQMFLHYDVTARRSRFSFDRSSGQYVKSLV